ncbi:pentapeptide repeat-containing protein [Geothermobacter hydrogeniphilus]|nr:pentapeptide repeat-containing protein [Geothermobacter hydrogeniphilus]
MNQAPVLSSSEAIVDPQPGDLLPGVDLSGRDFSGRNLAGIDLSGANLAGTRFFRTNLSGANLAEANLEGAEFAGAYLSGANLEGCRAGRAGFGLARLEKASLFRADLHEASFSRANLSGANLHCVDLRQARIREATLTHCDLSEADMQQADLSLTCVRGANFSNADLRGARLRRLQGFKRANWVGVDIRDINFAGAYLMRREIIDQNYIREFRSYNRLTALLYYPWWLTCDCGRSMLRWCFWIGIQAFFFAWLFTLTDVNYGDHATWLSPLYFSVVTLTTLGYGDVTPAGLSAQIVAMAEVTIGYIMLGGLLSIFSNKLARRGD